MSRDGASIHCTHRVNRINGRCQQWCLNILGIPHNQLHCVRAISKPSLPRIPLKTRLAAPNRHSSTVEHRSNKSNKSKKRRKKEENESQREFRTSVAGTGPVPGSARGEDGEIVGEGGSEDRGGGGGSGQVEEIDSLPGLGEPAASTAGLQHSGGATTARANVQHPAGAATHTNVEHPSCSPTRADSQHPARPLPDPDVERDPATDPAPGLFEGGPAPPAPLPPRPNEREHHPTTEGGEGCEASCRDGDREGEDREA